MPSTFIEDQIYKISLSNESIIPLNELTINDSFQDQKDPKDQDEDWDEEVEQEFEEGEEEIEEMNEMDLLEWMELHQDSLSICQSLFKDSIHPEFQELHDKGFMIKDSFLSETKANTLYTMALKELQMGHLKNPQETREDQQDPFRDNDARRDVIKWLKLDNDHGEYTFALQKLAILRDTLAEFMHLNGGMEFQLACYPSHGTFYQRHRDGFPVYPEDKEQRRVTAILYLNPMDWNESKDGGCLRIHRKESQQDLSPIGGRLVLFLSGVIDHEVLPSYRDRVALTAWFS